MKRVEKVAYTLICFVLLFVVSSCLFGKNDVYADTATYNDSVTTYHSDTSTLVLAGRVNRSVIMKALNSNGNHGQEYNVKHIVVSSQCAVIVDAYELFKGLENVTDIDLNGAFILPGIKSMERMFYNCYNLNKLVLGNGFDTSTVENMDCMFSRCSKLYAISLQKWFSTSSLKSAISMFSGDAELTYIWAEKDLDLCNLNEGGGKDAFLDCVSITTQWGNEYDSSCTDLSYARLDEGPSKVGYLMTMPAYDNIYAISVRNDSDVGSVSVCPSKNALSGQIVAVFADPVEGYQVSNYSVVTSKGEAVLVQDGKFIMPNDNVVVSASFEKLPITYYAVNVVNGEGGTVNVSSQSAAEGETVRVSTCLEDGYYYAEVSVKDSRGNAVPLKSNQFTMPNSDVTVSARCIKTPYKINITTDNHGKAILRRGDDIINVNDNLGRSGFGYEIKIEIQANVGYEFYSYSLVDSKGNKVPVNDWGFTMPKSDLSLTVQFKKKQYNVSVTQSDYGSVTVSKNTAKMGDTVNVTATPNPKYELYGLYYHYKSYTSSITNGSFVMPAADVTVYANFGPIRYSISTIQPSHGTISLSKNLASSGTKIRVYATPETGYELDTVIVDGLEIAGDEFVMPEQNATVSARFRRIRDVSYAVASEIAPQEFTGKELLPPFSLTFEGQTLVCDKDYVITGSSSKETGKGYIYVSGIGDYIGKTIVTFTITKRPIDNVTVDLLESYCYDGSPVEPKLKVYDEEVCGSEPLSDFYYNIDFRNNDTIGTASVIISGKHDYSGSVTFNFTIIPDHYSWKIINSKWRYVSDHGKYTTGFAEIDGSTYYFNNDGAMQTGWVSVDNGYYYFNKSGVMLKGWQKISKIWYYLNEDTGIMASGVQEIKGSLYWFKDSGALTSGWLKNSDNTYYYFTTNGAVKGWKKISKVRYYFDKDSAVMATGTKSIDGSIYLFADSGAMQKSGWKQSGNDWYYLTKSGTAYVNK